MSGTSQNYPDYEGEEMERAATRARLYRKTDSVRYGIGFSEPVISWDGDNTLYVYTYDKQGEAD